MSWILYCFIGIALPYNDHYVQSSIYLLVLFLPGLGKKAVYEGFISFDVFSYMFTSLDKKNKQKTSQKKQQSSLASGYWQGTEFCMGVSNSSFREQVTQAWV